LAKNISVFLYFSSILGNSLVILWWQMESNQNEIVMSIENKMEQNVNEMNIEKKIVGFFF